MIKISQRAAGQRNVTFNVWGTVSEFDAPEDIELKLGAKNLKLSSLVWLIEEKMGLYICQKPGEVWIPMESRNSVRFDHGLPIEEEILFLHPFANTKLEGSKERAFFLVMDFDK
jgi:hypothetical protein